MTGKATNDGNLRRAGERGFALVLAILSLMLLTFLGLTLATTTATELQIATNYRWSQQALYNAEAGLEAGRVILSNVADPGTYWLVNLPQPRETAGVLDKWASGSASAPTAADLSTATGRDFYKKDCDTRGGVGYGKVLTEATTRYENVSAYGGQSLNGAFTVWIRRDLTVSSPL